MTCKNQFLESDGFCTQCGNNHFKMQSTRTTYPTYRTPVTFKRNVEPSPVFTPAPKSTTRNHENYRKAVELTTTLANIYGIDICVKMYRGKKSFTTIEDGRITIEFGRVLDIFAEEGYRSYRKYSQYAAINAFGSLPKGDNAIAAHVAHEFAHALIFSENDNKYPYAHHGIEFQCKHREVLELVS